MLDMGILSPLLLGPTPLARIQSEVRYGTSSRVDFVLHAEDDTSTYVEVKSVTMVRHEEEDDGVRDGEQDGNKEEEGNTAVEESDMQSQYKVVCCCILLWCIVQLHSPSCMPIYNPLHNHTQTPVHKHTHSS